MSRLDPTKDTTTFKGLTWDHPRGYDALAEAASRVNAGRKTALIVWEKQPLAGFESAPIAKLAAANDLLVLDHPHIGEAVAENCLLPLETLFAPDILAKWAAQTVGPAFASYRWGGKTWAVPLDVATQVMARRPDYVPVAPSVWSEVIALAHRLPVAQSLAGPHALMSLFSIAGGEGAWPGGDGLLPDEAAMGALEVMHRLYVLRPKGSEALDPIELFEHMSCDNEIALVPLIFGYVNYATAHGGQSAIAFSDTICVSRGAGGVLGDTGGVLGGTGIGFSRRAAPSDELLDHVASLMTKNTQTGLIPANGGQPSARCAWTDRAVNARSGGFYAATIKTAQTALVRPRFDGYVAFQTAAGNLIRHALKARENEQKTLTALRAIWAKARNRARGDLDDERGPKK
jgi:multiple sugar transport system substrate-binding protein